MSDFKLESSAAKSTAEASKFNLNSLYDRLAVFVTDHANYRLRLASEEDSPEAAVEDGIDGMNGATTTAFSPPFIHLHILDLDAGVFVNNQQQVTLNHASLPSQPLIESFLRELPLERAEPDGQLEWLVDGSSESIDGFLKVLEQGIREREQLVEMVEAVMVPDNLSIAFSQQEANCIVADSSLTTFTARINWNTAAVIWTGGREEDLPFLEEINAIALKYRSVTDCLQSQLQMLIERFSENK